jgi:hypothetical protein
VPMDASNSTPVTVPTSPPVETPTSPPVTPGYPTADPTDAPANTDGVKYPFYFASTNTMEQKEDDGQHRRSLGAMHVGVRWPSPMECL